MSSLLRTRWLVALGVGVVVVVVATVLVVRGSAAAPAVPTTADHQAEEAASALITAYYSPSAGLLAQTPPSSGETYGPPSEKDTLFGVAQFTPTTVWDFACGLAGLEDVAQLPGGTSELSYVRTLATNLSAYWDAQAPVPGYAPTVHPSAHATKYFDDNAWVGLDLVEAYRLTKDPAYLTQAEAVFRYEESGWDPNGGGIYWNDQHITRNTPSNAPVAELGTYLYMLTHQSTYLDWAERIYNWEIQTLVNPTTGEVLDHIDPSGHINTAYWTYNQGTVIGSSVLLYEVTHQASYLRQAEKTAAYTLQHGVQANGVFVAQPQFNGILADNLELLYQVTRNPAISAAIARNVASALAHDRNAEGLFGSNWAGPVPTADVPILTDSGAVRLLAVNAILAHGGFPAFSL